jgi:predicted ATPase
MVDRVAMDRTLALAFNDPSSISGHYMAGGVCGGQTDVEAGFFRVFWFPCQSAFHQCAILICCHHHQRHQSLVQQADEASVEKTCSLVSLKNLNFSVTTE